MTDLVRPAPAEAAMLEPFRVELTGYCYRMLGSAFEAEDAVQETMVRAWRGLDRFEGRSSLRGWLYRIATNVCLTMLRGRGRRALPVDLGPDSPGEAGLGARLPEGSWVEPIADTRALPTGGDPADPAELAVSRETIRLAFVAALQHLPPRQRAVLILRDVLRWRAHEVAALLDTSVVSVKSALQRARTTLAAADVAGTRPTGPATGGAAPGDGEGDGDEAALLARYVDAFERYDVDELVSLLHEDATLSMPPFALWLRGRDAIARWWRGPGTDCAGSVLVPTRANGAPAFGQFRPDPATGRYEPFALSVLELSAGRVTAVQAFLGPEVLAPFGLRAPARGPA